MRLDQTAEVVAEILARRPEREQAIPSRYPFTYAYDFLRTHAAIYGLPIGMSRGEAGVAITRFCENMGLDRGEIVAQLADAYLIVNDVEMPLAERKTLLAQARSESWKSMGLPKPQKP